jgi:hypothetical protein
LKGELFTPAQEASAVFRRKAIYEELHPETKHGANQHTRGVDKLSTPSDRFTAATSEATGKDERTIRRAAARASSLGPDLSAVAGTSLDKGVELDALAKMRPGERPCHKKICDYFQSCGVWREVGSLPIHVIEDNTMSRASDEVEKALSNAIDHYPPNVVSSKSSWIVPEKLATQKQILGRADNHPLVTVTCVSNKVNVRFVTDIAPAGFHDVILEAEGDNFDSATAYAREVILLPVAPYEEAVGHLIIAKRVALFDEGLPITAPWTLIKGAPNKEILQLDDHPTVSVVCKAGEVLAKFITDKGGDGTANVTLKGKIGAEDSATFSARQVELYPVGENAFGEIRFSKPVW